VNAWGRFVDRLSGTESATSLSLFRLAMGVGVWHTVGPVVWRGLVPILWVDAADGGYLPLGDGPWLIALLGGPHPLQVWSFVAVALLAGTAMALGVGGRLAALAALLATNSLTDVNPYAGGSYDMLLANGLWLCVLGGGDATLSLTARVRTGRWWPRVEVWAAPRWLAGFQLVLMYCTTGLQKLSAFWVPGGEHSALYYILQQPEWQRRPMEWVAPLYPLTQLATLVSWFWEVGAPLWLLAVWFAATPERGGRVRAWFARLGVRWVFALVGLGMHVVIFATMDVGPFSYLSLAFYTVMWAPEEWERWLRRAP
jgi:hypothetical protein